MRAARIGEARGGRLQAALPDPVRDVLAVLVEQLLQPAQRHAHRRREQGRIEGRIAEIGLDERLGALDHEGAVHRPGRVLGEALGEARDDEVDPDPDHALGAVRRQPIALAE